MIMATTRWPRLCQSHQAFQTPTLLFNLYPAHFTQCPGIIAQMTIWHSQHHRTLSNRYLVSLLTSLNFMFDREAQNWDDDHQTTSIMNLTLPITVLQLMHLSQNPPEVLWLVLVRSETKVFLLLVVYPGALKNKRSHGQ